MLFFTIVEKTEVFTEHAKIVDIYGQGCHRPTKKGVEGFEVRFQVELYAGESKMFHIVFQSEDRSDNLKAYSGYEMRTAKRFGCDADESTEALEFTDGADAWLEELQKTAEEECKKWRDKQSLFRVGDKNNGVFSDTYTVIGDACDLMYDCIEEGIQIEVSEGMRKEEAREKVEDFYYVAMYNWNTQDWEEIFEPELIWAAARRLAKNSKE